ncbi:FliH/SctL family protein [Effusibacillus consociatus]|uniref:FliH/SctL family protein n=1 Tax=Effusibacillus consociatus TaxID=1117041 RepID=A0ABV9Q3C3_9BACL
MSKIVKSLYTTVAGQRTIHTVPVVKVITPPGFLNHESEPQEAEPVLSPEEIIKEAQKQAARMLENTRREADLIVNDAKRQAEAILTDSRRQVEEAVAQAQKAGYEIGFEEGKTAGETLFQEKIQEVLGRMSQIEAERQEYLLQSEQQLLVLACEIARRIMGREIELGMSWVEATLKGALAELVNRSHVEVHAHPDDIPLLIDIKSEISSPYNAQIEFKFTADSSIEKGGCILRTRQGAVDARIDTQLNEVKRALLETAAALSRE